MGASPTSGGGGRTIAEAFVTLRPKMDGFAEEAAGKLKGVSDKIALATVGVAGAIGGIGVAATTAFASFEKGMNEVATLLPTFTNQQLKELDNKVLSLSKNLGVLPGEVVPALYQSLSAGVPPGNVFEFLETSFKAATAGGATLETAVNALTSVVNAYGAETVDAAKASDIMFTAVRLGKTDFRQLDAALFNVVPTAASLGVKFEEVAASLAVMTARGVPTSVATTQLRALFVEFSRDSTKLSQAFAAISGQSFPEFIRNGGTVTDALAMMRDNIPDDEFRNLFSSVEAANAALLMSGPNTEAMRSALAETMNSAGATDAAFAAMDQGLARTWTRIKANAQVAMIQIGAAIAPVVDKALTWFADHLPGAMDKAGRAFRAIADAAQPFVRFVRDDALPAIERFAATVRDAVQPVVDKLGNWFREHAEQLRGPVAAAIGGVLVVAFGSLAVAAGSAAAAVIAATWPILAVVAAAALLSAGIYALVENWDSITERFPILGTIVDAVKVAFQEAARITVDYVWPALRMLAEFMWERVIPVWIEIHRVVIELAIRAIREFAGFVDERVIPVVRTMVEWFAENVAPVIADVARWIVDVLVPALVDVATWIGEHVVTAARAMWEFVSRYVIPVVAEIGRIVADVVVMAFRGWWIIITEGVIPVVTELYGWIADNVIPVVERLAGLLAGALVAGFEAAKVAVSTIISFFGWLWDKVSAVIDAVKDLIDWLGKLPDLGDITGAIGNVAGKIPGFADGGFVRAGQLAIVGERGPELFRPAVSGTIIPNEKMGGGVTVNFNGPITVQTIDADPDGTGVLADVAFATAAELRARGVVA
jgi:TP901 family phage tail tape measure protein